MGGCSDQGLPKNNLDPRAIELKVGLEVHQQLATKTKLFCSCPPYSGDAGASSTSEPNESRKGVHEFRRILRPATSELGELDIAARFESRKDIRVRYLSEEGTSCLVEADEEPPRPINQEAVDTSLIFALALNSKIADEIHVMRKIVVDGSNTSGFQRTAVISLGGELKYNGGKSAVDVQSISLEEDAARTLKEQNADSTDSEERVYALDRLGTPLVEVALAPIEGSPEDVEDAARTLGRMMRSTGRIARGLGTIRQDLNISVLNGNVIEVKGVQRLDQISKIVLFEAARQKFFFDLAKEISGRLRAKKLEISTLDVTGDFKDSGSQVLRRALLRSDSCVQVIVVKGFAGYFGKENEYHSRLGKELGAIAKTYGLGGIFHSDELPNYGITLSEIQSLKSRLNLAADDGFVLIAGAKTKVERALHALVARIQDSTEGVPAETRAASLDGETTFLRPRPGSARMYPETDIPLIQVSKERLERLERLVPEPWEARVEKFGGRYDLPRQLADPLFDSEFRSLFENIVAKNASLSPRYVASVFVDTFQSIAREGFDVYSIDPAVLRSLFDALGEGKFAKEATPSVLRALAASKDQSLEGALKSLGYSAMSKEELQNVVKVTIEENQSLLRSKGTEGARGAIMGRVMQKVRGKADGKLVSEMVAALLQEQTGREEEKKKTVYGEKVNQ